MYNRPMVNAPSSAAAQSTMLAAERTTTGGASWPPLLPSLFQLS